MILIAGGTGLLGSQVTHLLTERGRNVRILTRDPGRLASPDSSLIETVSGDVRDPQAVERAAVGATTIISAIHGFSGTGQNSPRTIDKEGNSNLIRAAVAAGAGHFILISIQGATPDHPMELFRMKFSAEQELKNSGLTWTIISPTAYMETWGKLVGEPVVKTGKTTIFGRGNNPVNFVSAHDVARFVDLAVTDPALRGVRIEVGGPENLTMKQVVHTFETVTGKTGKTSHVPLPAMRLMSVFTRPINATLARQIQAGVVMDTRDMSFDAQPTRRRYPSIPATSLAEVVRRDYA